MNTSPREFLKNFLSSKVLKSLRDSECSYLSDVFSKHQGYPSLYQLWKLMDEAWQNLNCDPLQLDDRVTAFYNHPVWLLNGLFIEQDPQSLAHRHGFTSWVQALAPMRVADYGGGFGTLARFIGTALPSAKVEVVEPHPHPAAIDLVSDSKNVCFVPELTNNYDLLIATDIFEHVHDPIGLAASTAAHLRVGGSYLIANCFSPVVQCHLPQLFHLQIGWDQAMKAMGLQPGERVRYGRAYKRLGKLDEAAARSAEALAQQVYPWFRLIPKGRSRLGKAAIHLLAVFSDR